MQKKEKPKMEKPTQKNKKAVFFLAIACGVLFLGGVGGSIWNLTRGHGRQVEILQDGEVLYTIDLEQAEDQTIPVTYEGRTNVIEIQDHKIRVREADCPDQICVQMDWLDAAPIVCLPNHLSIQYTDEKETTGLDAVAS